VSPCSTSAGKVHVGQLKLLPALCMSTNEHESPMSIDFRATNIVDMYSANTESMNNEDQLNYESNFQNQI